MKAHGDMCCRVKHGSVLRVRAQSVRGSDRQPGRWNTLGAGGSHLESVQDLSHSERR